MRMPVELLLPHLNAVLEGLLIWAEDSKNKFKLKVWTGFRTEVWTGVRTEVWGAGGPVRPLPSQRR
jgi:hypothetical protein